MKYLIIITIIIIYSCNSNNSKTDEAISIYDSVKETATKVNTAFSMNKDFIYKIQSNGKIKSLHDQNITTEIGGILIYSNVKSGMKVNKGTVLAKFESTPILFKLERAKLNHFNSVNEYESQLLSYEKLLFDKEKLEADNIKQKLKISTGLAAAEQEINEANYALEKTIIKAPFDGILSDIKIQEGQLIKPGEELFKIYNSVNLLLEIKILEADVQFLMIGTPAVINPISVSEKKYKATVYEINPNVDENGMISVKLKFNNPLSIKNRRSLFPGMNCIAIINVPINKSIIVPKESIVMRSGKFVVFTLENGKAKWNYVTIGKDNGQEVEIIEGLKQGLKVITSNNLQLAHNVSVSEIDN